MSETVTVTARRWSGGWELWNGDDCWTQVARLDRARQQVVDYLDTVDEDTDHSDWTITVIPEVASLDRVHAARETAARARALQEEAATAWREAALALRAEGLSVADAATIMGVSRGRISQLTA
ncbi:antitoxin HicB [uncultured Actinomyces sp.]|uniref:antitoxin HicB n=1 Tax=uncultured Actinomyces sp. TaxID=249061 RepID=UPI00288A56DA|nr:antitoxin HicB [uncultured Actinomyces sp.]